MKKCISMALLLFTCAINIAAWNTETLTFRYNNNTKNEWTGVSTEDTTAINSQKCLRLNEASKAAEYVTVTFSTQYNTGASCYAVGIDPTAWQGSGNYSETDTYRTGVLLAYAAVTDGIIITARQGYKITNVKVTAAPNGVGTKPAITIQGTYTLNGSATTQASVSTYLTTAKTSQETDAYTYSSSGDYTGFDNVSIGKTAGPISWITKVVVDVVPSYSDYIDENGTEVTTCENKGVELIRTLSSEYWNTFCVPFDIDESTVTSIFGSGNVKSFGAYDAANSTIKMEDAASISAGTPYLVKPAEDVVNPEFSNVTISSTDAPAAQTLKDADGNDTGVSVQGTYVSLSNVSAENGTACYLTTDNTIETFAAANTLKGMRAYFIIPSSDGAKETSLDFGDGKTTGIDAIDGGNALTESGSPKYNLAGQRVGNGYKGVVIVNGKKMIMK